MACRVQVLDVLGDAVTGDRAGQLLQQAGGSPRRAVNAFFDQSAGLPSSCMAASQPLEPIDRGCVQRPFGHLLGMRQHLCSNVVKYLLTGDWIARGAASQPTDGVPSLLPQRQASAAKAAKGKRKAPARVSGVPVSKIGGSGGGGKKAKQQQPDASQRSIRAFFSKSPSCKADNVPPAPVPAQHCSPSAQIAKAGCTDASVKQEPFDAQRTEVGLTSACEGCAVAIEPVCAGVK